MNLKSKNNVETNKYELVLEVSAEEFNEAILKVYKKEVKKMNIPGFRKGKAPRAFVEKYYGEQVFFEAAVDSLYRTMVNEAIEKSELKVISMNDFKIDEIGKETGVTATLTVITKPEVEIKGYKGLEVAKEPVVVTDGEVDTEIDRVRERNSRMVPVEDRAAENGDIVTIDFDGYVDEKQFDGGKAERYDLTLGANQFIPGFEEQVIGHSIGEEFDANVTFPEEYHADELRGKDAVFKIKLHEIKKKELPELDDEFVKDVSEFDTLDEYKEDIKKGLLEKKEQSANGDIENQIVDKLCEQLEAEIPHEMVHNEVHDMMDQFSYRLQSQGLDLDTYLKYTNMTKDDMHEQYEGQAERQVKIRLALEKIAVTEEITATDEELDAEYEKLAKAYEMPLDNVKNMVSSDMVSADIVNQKVMDFIKDNAKITEAVKEEPKEESEEESAKKTNAKKAETEKNEGDTLKTKKKASSAKKTVKITQGQEEEKTED